MKEILKKQQNIAKDEKTEVKNALFVTEEKQEKSSRRHFLKKAVYSAPVLMVLGQLVTPTNVQAVGSPPGTPRVW